jgi:hypothetical protein
MKRTIGFFMVIMGALMAAMWSFLLLSGLVPELKTVPFTTAAHLAAEFSTAALMIFGGTSILKRTPQAEKIALVGWGMFTYAVIQAPGYFLQQGEVGFVIVFAIFVLLGLAAIKTLI